MADIVMLASIAAGFITLWLYVRACGDLIRSPERRVEAHR